MDEARVYQITVYGFENIDDTLAAHESIARILCPEPEHDGPCPVPWEFTVGEDNTLILGVHTVYSRAETIAEEVRAVSGRHVELSPGDPERFEMLMEQYRIESSR